LKTWALGANVRTAGMTLLEVMCSATIGLAVVGAFVESVSDLSRHSAAVIDYTTSEGDQMRISDYIAFDVRRSLSTNVVKNVLTVTIPDYYGNSGATPAAGTTPKDPTLVNGNLTYGASPITITYYQQGSSFYRAVNGAPTAIAQDVADFTVNVATTGEMITCTTTFSPSFTWTPAAGAIAATSVCTSVYPRNIGAQP
jgi:hypothetical protein